MMIRVAYLMGTPSTSDCPWRRRTETQCPSTVCSWWGVNQRLPDIVEQHTAPIDAHRCMGSGVVG